METVEFLGIIFRSAHHMHWFIITMIQLSINAVLFIILVLKKWPLETMSKSCCFQGFTSGITSLIAVHMTKGGAINGRVWSADCIWYNGMLAGIYFLITALPSLLVYLEDARQKQINLSHPEIQKNPP